MAELPENTGAGLASAYVPLEVDACSITYDEALGTAFHVRSTCSVDDASHMKAPEDPPSSALGALGAPEALASPGDAGDERVQWVPDSGGPGATIVSLPDDGDTELPSLDVCNEYVDFPSVPGGPLTTAMVITAAVEAAREHVFEPLLVR